MVNRQAFHVGSRTVASHFIHIPAQVKMHRIAAHYLLTHVLQFNIGQMNRSEVLQYLPKKVYIIT